MMDNFADLQHFSLTNPALSWASKERLESCFRCFQIAFNHGNVLRSLKNMPSSHSSWELSWKSSIYACKVDFFFKFHFRNCQFGLRLPWSSANYSTEFKFLCVAETEILQKLIQSVLHSKWINTRSCIFPVFLTSNFAKKSPWFMGWKEMLLPRCSFVLRKLNPVVVSHYSEYAFILEWN